MNAGFIKFALFVAEPEQHVAGDLSFLLLSKRQLQSSVLDAVDGSLDHRDGAVGDAGASGQRCKNCWRQIHFIDRDFVHRDAEFSKLSFEIIEQVCFDFLFVFVHSFSLSGGLFVGRKRVLAGNASD